MGKKYRLVIVVLGLIVFSFSGISCKKKEKPRIPASAMNENRGELHVVNVSPKGSTQGSREADEIVVIFDHPMAALEPLPLDETTSFLKFEPPFSGKFRWMGTKALAFSPKDRLPFATEINVTVPAGTRSVDGYVLKENYVWTFSTIRPRLIRHFPEDNAGQQKLDTGILLVFNQPVDDSRAKEFITLSGSGAGSRDSVLDFSLRHPSAAILKDAEIANPSDNVLLLKSVAPLKPDFTYGVGILAGLPGRAGRLPLDTPVAFGFQTYNTFAFEDLENAENHSPSESLVFKFTNRVIYRDLVPKLRIEPNVDIPEYYREWDHGAQSLWLDLPLQPETKYAIRIDAGLKDEFGNALGKDAVIQVQTLSYPPAVRMTTGHGVLEAYGELTYPVYAVNAPQLRLQAARLSKDQVIPILLSPKSLSSNESFLPWAGFYQVDRSLDLKLPRNIRRSVPLNVKEFIPEKYGLLLLQLDTRSEDKWDRYPKAFLQVTDLGITGKFSPEANVVWVTELRTGMPVPDAEIELRDDANISRWKGRTDKDGKVQTPGWKVLGVRSKDAWEKPQQWVFARRGDDCAFTSSEWGTGIAPYRFGIAYDWNPEPEKIQAAVFSERGIYRAGETVHIKGIVRSKDAGRWRIPAVKDVTCEILDPFQKSVHKGRSALDAYGSFSLDIETREDASLGTYTIVTKIPPEFPGEKESRFTDSYRVEAFRAAEFEVHLRALKESFVFGDHFQAEIRGTYLFGGAMAGQKAKWTLRLDQSSFAPPGYKEFVFGSEISYDEGEDLVERSRIIASGDAVLGPDGKIDVKVPLVAEKEKTTAGAVLEATVQSPSRRSISNRIQTYVHQGEFYIGLKPGTMFLKQGETLPVQVITTAPDGSLSPDKKISVKLVKREWRSARKSGVGGRFKWISERVDTETASLDVQTKDAPVEVSFKPEKSGFYLISAAGQDGRKNPVTTTTYIYVTGKDYVPWDRKDEDALDLVASGDAYKPGDKARIMIKSPYEKAKALVTIERESILQTQVLDIQGSASEIEIPVTSDLIPNAYVSVLLVQGRTSQPAAGEAEDVGKPSFKIGYLMLKVDPSEKRLTVDLIPDKKGYKPKDTVKVRLKVTDANKGGAASSVALAAVDVGVLNLIGYRTPDPFSAFYGERPLSVQTSETRIHVVGQRNLGEKGENAGGGGAEARGVAGLGEVELRGDFKSTAHWNPSIVTDANGEAVVQFALPDNLTTFRIMAVAQTQDSRFGNAESNIKVSKPLLLLPSTPRFARVGDKFSAGVVVNNYSEKKGLVSLALEAKGLVAEKTISPREIMLGPGESQEVLYAVEADRPGKAVLGIRAKMGEDSDGIELTIPVEMPRPTEAVATYGEVGLEPKEETVNLPDSIYPDQSRIEVQAAASALSGLSGTLDYLSSYPYLCLEQRLSMVLPYLVAPQIIRDFNLSPYAPNEIQVLIKKTIKEVYGCQKDSGGFGLWPDSSLESPFVSCYAVFALLKAQAAGYEIDRARLDNALTYLKSLLKAKPDRYHPYNAASWKTTEALALYALSLAGKPEAAYAEKLFKERDVLSLFGRTYLLKALHLASGSPTARTTLLQDLLNKVKITPSQAHFEEEDDAGLRWVYSSNARTTAIILQALVETGSDFPRRADVARWLVDQRKTSHWQSTQENFFVFYALNDFYQSAEKSKPDFRAEISLAQKMLLKETFQSVNQTARAALSLAGFKTGTKLPLKIAKSGPGTLYYGARLIYAPKQALEPRDEGLAVYRTIGTPDGKPLDSIKSGSLVVVTLQVVVPKETLFVVVDDPLPAGFEAVNSAFLTESEGEQRKLDQLEEETEDFWWEGFNHVEMHDNRVLLFADSLRAGVHTYRYLARALTFGQFTLPGARAEQMYAPEVFGRSVERTVKIVK